LSNLRATPQCLRLEWNLGIRPKIAKLASRHSERDEGQQVIEMRRHFPHGRFGPIYESSTYAANLSPI